ncbi:MAG: 50S ribosomal protein L1 [Candidatus Micrarchaeia archaeon]
MAGSNIDEFKKFFEEQKGKRKFKQSVELALNFKGVDFTKQDNRINLEVALPHSKGKTRKVAIIAEDPSLVSKAKAAGLEVIDGSSISAIASDPARMNKLIEYDLIAQPNLMPAIAKSMGQFLGPRNKMPKPLIGINLETLVSDLSKKINIKSKGRFLPTVHCVVGSEDMPPEEVYENIRSVIDAVTKKVGQGHIKSAYVKFSMSRALKIA